MIKNIPKVSLLILLIFSFNSSTWVQGAPQVNLKGGYEFQAAFYRNNNTNNNDYVSAHRKNIGFNSSGHVNIELQNVIENFIEYGARVSLETTSRNDRRVASFLYALSDYGKLEGGSDKSANNKMKVTGYSIACGTAGGWDSWVRLPSDARRVAFVTNFGNFLDAKTRLSNRVEYSRKISYFTPKFYNFQIGVSYIPDTSNTGYDVFNKSVLYDLAKPLRYKFAITDGIAYGISYEDKPREDLKIKSSVVGEKGKIKKIIDQASNNLVTTKFKNLSTYTIGSEVHYKQFAVAAGYSNYMKSLTSADIDTISRTTNLYSVGARYKYNDFVASSLNYFYGNYKKNIVGATTLAIDYILAPGFLSYAELTYYTTRGKYLENSVVKTDKTNGQVLVIGTKLEF